jgi:hypothetical protein
MNDERRRVERRAMPADVRALVEQLRAISRASGVQTKDGTDWRTIPRTTVDAVVEVLVRAWRPDDTTVSRP